MKRILIMMMVACLLATAGYGLTRKAGDRTMVVEETKLVSVSYNADKIIKLRKQALQEISKLEAKIAEYDELIDMFDSVGIPAVPVVQKPKINWSDVSKVADVGVNWTDVQTSTIYSTRPYDERMSDKMWERSMAEYELRLKDKELSYRKDTMIETAKLYSSAEDVKVIVHN